MCFLNIFLLVAGTVYVGAQTTTSVTQHPGNDTFCEGSNAVLSCVIFDNSTNNAADTTRWFAIGDPPAAIPRNLVVNTRDGDVVTSVLTIESVSLNDNGNGYFCSPAFNNPSYVGVISVAVPPMTAPTINIPTMLSSRSFTISWTISDPDHNYIVTWTNLRTGMMSSVTVPENTNSYMVTGLNGVDNYNVSVTANNSCGMMMSDPITVYGTNTNAACETAVNTVDGSCFLLLRTADPAVCSGTCGTQVSTAATTCANVIDLEVQEFIAAYNIACQSEAECRAALTAWNADATCVDAINTDDTAIYCSGTCGELIDDVLNICPNNAFLSRGEYNQDCGFGTDSDSSNVLQSAGTITLLITAICTLIF